MRNSKIKLGLSVIETKYMKLLKLKLQQTIEQTETTSNGKGMFMKLLKIIGAIITFIAALLTCLYYLGWLEPVKAFIYKILLHR